MSRENVYPAGPYQARSRYGRANTLYNGLEYSSNDPTGYVNRWSFHSPGAIASIAYPSSTGTTISPANFIDVPIIDGRYFALENIFTIATGAAAIGVIQLYLNRQLVLNEMVFNDYNEVPTSTSSGSSGLTLRSVYRLKFDLIRAWTLSNIADITWTVMVATGLARIIQVQR
jgi:hypothetical protein